MDDHKQIGEAADRIGLSLRTIRYYEEVGLIASSARSLGGFRLCAETDIARLMVVKQMKPLGFGLDELEREELSAAGRCASLRSQLETPEAFARSLRRESRQQIRTSENAGRHQ